MNNIIIGLICISLLGVILALNISIMSKLLMIMLLVGMVGSSVFEDGNTAPPAGGVAGGVIGGVAGGVTGGVAGGVAGGPPLPLLPHHPVPPPRPRVPDTSLAASRVAALTPEQESAALSAAQERTRAKMAASAARAAERNRFPKLEMATKAAGAMTSAWILASVTASQIF